MYRYMRPITTEQGARVGIVLDATEVLQRFESETKTPTLAVLTAHGLACSS